MPGYTEFTDDPGHCSAPAPFYEDLQSLNATEQKIRIRSQFLLEGPLIASAAILIEVEVRLIGRALEGIVNPGGTWIVLGPLVRF